MNDIRLVAFDLDDTLAPSKSKIDPQMAILLTELLKYVPVCIISGGRFEQFSSQVLDELDQDADLTRLHLMPTCGTQYYARQSREWSRIYAEDLSDAEKASAIASLTAGAHTLGLWSADTWGPVIEDRGSQITFSALGQEAPVDAKKNWDPTGDKKERLRSWVAARLPELEVRSGGSTSIDITRKNIDKAYGMNKIMKTLNIGTADVVFVGDRLDPGGNDYPVKEMGIRCIAVTEWQDTTLVIRDLINELADGPA